MTLTSKEGKKMFVDIERNDIIAEEMTKVRAKDRENGEN